MRSLTLLGGSLLGVLLFSTAIVLPAQATQWVGNDNGEFDVNGGYTAPSWVYAEATFNTAMAWTPPTCCNTAFQYNPDYDTSHSQQTGHPDWFQTVIASNSYSYINFAVQVWNMAANTCCVWQASYGPQTVTGGLSSGAQWYVEEDESSTNHYVKAVQFEVVGGGSGGGSLYYKMYPPQQWKWLRSNICWCGGVLGAFTTYTSGGGSLLYGSNVGMYPVVPPTDTSTLENSNMQYSCFSQPGSATLTQSFGLSSHC